MANVKNVNTEEEVVMEQSFLVKNWKMVCGAICAVVVVVLGYMCYKQFIVEPKEKAANEAIASCQTLMMQGLFEKALDGDGQGCIGLKQVISQYGSTDAGNLAQAYAGIAYYNLANYDEAVKALESFKDCGDIAVSPAAIACLGNCYACQKQYDKAVDKLVEAADKANSNALSPMFLMQAAEIYENALNNNEKALECYKKVQNDYNNSYQSQDIDKYIEHINNK